jgi:molybdate-binding protein/DNA-binding XRE family transcriptional regulator
MGRRVTATELESNVRAARVAAGLSQQALAERAGLTRQAVNAIEAGRYTPNTVVAIRLAQALACRVEDLFRVPEALPSRSAALATGACRPGDRVVVGRVGEKLVAHGLTRKRAAPDGFAAADGIVRGESDIQLFIPPDEVERTAFLVGCDPSLGMLASWVSRRARDARLVWVPGSSQDALDALRHSTAHIAGIHLRDARTGEFNLAHAERALAHRGGIVMSYADWEQGFVVQRGNPKKLGGVDALARRGVRLVNREPGSGSRALLDQMLKSACIAPERVAGYGHVVHSHMAVARAVADGVADLGLGLRAVAAAQDLDFVPVVDVKFDLVIPNEHLDHPAIDALLEVLQSGTLRAELGALPGYGTGQTGEVRRRVGSVA